MPLPSATVKAVGLTGGIGSGKSTVAAALAARGAVVHDADAVVRELQRPGQPVHRAIVERFGPAVVGAGGGLDRRALAETVFADAGALADLERLTHPEVAAVVAERLAAAAGSHDVVVLEVPLLLETGHYQVAGVIVVDCPVETAVRRLMEQRGMAEADVRARMASQMPREERVARADFVIDNSGPPEALPPQVEAAWAWIETLVEA